ncbi:MAG: 8-amino-7-oxononanoate synthase [Polyangiales bacterium]
MTNQWFESDLDEQRAAMRLREPRTLEYRDNTHAMLNGQLVTVFCGNDYLGLRSHPRLADDVREQLTRGAVGAGASRLVSGDLPIFTEAESAFARLTGTETSLLFSSGFAANVGTLPAIANTGDVIFSDALNHASIVDGCRLSRAQTVVFAHANIGALRAAINSARPFRRGWIVTESVFSMDGDVAPIAELRSIADHEGLGLYVDEAHGIGVFGSGGRGVCSEQSVRADVLIGTLGKALGGAGAFVAGSESLRLWLWNRARSFVFSTGVSVPNAAMALAAVRLLEAESGRMMAVRARAVQLRAALLARGVGVSGRDDCPIIPVMIGDDARAVSVSLALLERGFFVSAIRPPTVPRGTSRLRITVSAMHTEDEIERLAAATWDCLR